MWFDLFSFSWVYWLDVSSLSQEVSGTLGEAEDASEPVEARSAEKGKMQEHPANSGTGDRMEIWRRCLWQTLSQEQRWHFVSLRDKRASLGMAEAVSVNLHVWSGLWKGLWCQPVSHQRAGCHPILKLVFMVPAQWNALESRWVCLQRESALGIGVCPDEGAEM